MWKKKREETQENCFTHKFSGNLCIVCTITATMSVWAEPKPKQN